jgi:hypothetical protein
MVPPKSESIGVLGGEDFDASDGYFTASGGWEAISSKLATIEMGRNWR